jgi:hypothetical protein
MTPQAYLGHRNIQHTVWYTELAPGRFKDFWRQLTWQSASASFKPPAPPARPVWRAPTRGACGEGRGVESVIRSGL